MGKHGANMGAADVRRGQDSSASRSWTGGPEFTEATGTVRNYRCWGVSKVDAPRIQDSATAHSGSQDSGGRTVVRRLGQRGSLLYVAIAPAAETALMVAAAPAAAMTATPPTVATPATCELPAVPVTHHRAKCSQLFTIRS
jgi:hypothetical protein